MALSGGRIITVAGHRLRWVEACPYHRPTRTYELRLIVQSASGQGQRLVVRLPWGAAEQHKTKPVSRPLFPAWVARCVTAAYKRGFKPALRKPALVVTFASLLPDEPWPPTSRELRAALAKEAAPKRSD